MYEQHELGRRAFLRHAGVGLSAVGMSGALPLEARGEAFGAAGDVAGQPQQPAAKIEFPPDFKATERPESRPPNPDPPASRVGLAIVGLGRLSLGDIVPAIVGECKHARVAALVTGDRAKGLAVARQYGLSERQVYGYDEYTRLRDDRAVDATYVVLPNSMHAEHTVRAAEAGKHVLCEKPMANSVAECEQMIAACAKANRRLMIAYRIQYEPRHRLAQRIVRGEVADLRLGKVTLIDLVNCQAQGRVDQWRLKKALAGGGALPDIGLYCLNTARFLTGEEPVEIRAMEYSTPNDPRYREVEESVFWQMRFPSGTIATCTTSYSGHTNKRYRVSLEDGWVEMDPAFPYSGLRLRTAHVVEGAPRRERIEEHQMKERNQFALEIDHFAECVRAGRQPYTPGEEGLQDQRLTEAIYRAARDGRPVTLPAVATRDAFRGPPPTSES